MVSSHVERADTSLFSNIKTKLLPFCGAVLLASSLASCSNYDDMFPSFGGGEAKPAVEEKTTQGAQDAPAIAPPAAAIAAPAHPRWWDAMRDPHLNRLVGQLMQQNNSPEIAFLRKYRAKFARDRALGVPDNMVRTAQGGSFEYQHILSQAAQPYDLPRAPYYELAAWHKIENSTLNGAFTPGISQWEVQALQKSQIAELVGYYVGYRTAQAVLKLREKQLEYQEEILTLAYKHLGEGKAKDKDVALAHQSKDTLEALVEKDKQRVGHLKQDIALLMGHAPDALDLGPFEEGKTALDHILRLPKEIPSHILYQRMDIKQPVERLEMAQRQGVMKRLDKLPSFMLSDAMGAPTNALKDIFHHKFFALQPESGSQPQLIPETVDPAQLQIAESQFAVAELAYKRATYLALLEVESALTENAKLVAKYREGLKQHDHAMSLLRATLQQRPEEKADRRLLELNQLMDVLSARMALFDALRSLINNRITLLKAVGGSFETNPA
jgi:outer membrane protein TolC